MKKLLGVSVVVYLLAGSSGLVAAEDNGLYAGIGTGRLDFDFDDARFRTSTGAFVSGSSLALDIESGTALRLNVGYNWGGWAFEAAYEHMLESVDVDAGAARLTSFDYSNFTLGGVYRSSGTLYFIGKVGLSLPNLDPDTGGIRLKMGNSAYYGAGLGYRLTALVSLEFDYTQTNDDTGTFMLGLRRHF